MIDLLGVLDVLDVLDVRDVRDVLDEVDVFDVLDILDCNFYLMKFKVNDCQGSSIIVFLGGVDGDVLHLDHVLLHNVPPAHGLIQHLFLQTNH